MDGAREIMGLALNKLGYSLNDTNPNHLKEAEKDLHHLAQVRGVVGDEVTMMLEQNEGNIAVVWSGVAAPLVQNSDKYNYVIPKEGLIYGLITWLFLRQRKTKKVLINL